MRVHTQASRTHGVVRRQWPRLLDVRSQNAANGHMAEEPEHQPTLEELKETIRSVLEALRNHENPTSEIREIVTELSQIERQLLDGLLCQPGAASDPDPDSPRPRLRQPWHDMIERMVICRAGDIDIAAFECELTFGAERVELTGRHANELFATIGEAGVPPEGAAGTIYEGIHAMRCVIDPSAVA
jgi:hypothetical protein